MFRSINRTKIVRALLISALTISIMAVQTYTVSYAQERKFGPTPSAPGAAVYFIDLKDGDTIPTTSTIHFGLRNMGIAPAGSEKANSGHHHLLIDTELPPLDEPIPSDFNHVHFGTGQTEAEVTLTPGEHTLQLLLGDKNHIPHNPPIISDRIRVKVVDNLRGVATSQASPSVAPASTYLRRASPAGAKVYFVYPTANAVVGPTVTVRFGLVGMGVAPAGFDKANTGHHHLLVDSPLPPLDEPIPSDFNHIHFGQGQTEAKVTLPLGYHTLQLLLADANHVPHNPPVMSEPIRILVTASGKPPGPRPHFYQKSTHRQRYRRSQHPTAGLSRGQPRDSVVRATAETL